MKKNWARRRQLVTHHGQKTTKTAAWTQRFCIEHVPDWRAVVVLQQLGELVVSVRFTVSYWLVPAGHMAGRVQ